MLVNLYKTKTPLAVFSFPLVIAVLGLPLFLLESKAQPTFFSWQTALENKVISEPLLHYGLAVFIVYLAGIELNRLVNVFGFYSKNTYLPGLIFAISLLGFGEFVFSIDLVAYALLIFGTGFLFRINRQDSALSSVFMGAFFYGAATVFEPLLMPLLLLPWFTLVVFRSFIWREWFLTIIGAGLPWIYFVALTFIVSGKLEMTPVLSEVAHHELRFTSGILTLIGFVVILFLYASWRYLIILNTQLLVIKKRSRILFHFVWISVISLGLGWLIKDNLIMAVNIPLAIIVAVQMLTDKQILASNLILYGWLSIAVWILFL